MCHAHPYYHPCSHTSVKWLYCPEANFDMATGYETPCSNPIYSAAQSTNANCPLQNCNFKKLKGSWNCCVCNKGPNTQGWCTVPRSVQDWNPLAHRYEVIEEPCGHGCCSKCTRAPSSRASSPEMTFQEGRTTKSGRKSHGSSRSSGHKRSTTYDFTANFPAVTEEQEDQEASGAAAVSPRSRGSRKSGYDTNVDYSSKRTKTSSTKGGHKGRKHGGW